MASAGTTHLFHCPICFNAKEARQPRVLMCQHSFCTECLSEWHSTRLKTEFDSDKEIKCPVCMMPSAVPPNGVRDFPLDFKVTEASEVIAAMQSVSLCQKCCAKGISSPLKALCVDCDIRFCEQCATGHKEVDLFNKHKLVYSLCKIHSCALKYVCVTCMEGLCSKCVVLGSHSNHNVLDCNDGLLATKTKLEERASKVKSAIAYVKAKIRITELHKGKHLTAVATYIKERRDAILKELDRIMKIVEEQHKERHNTAIKGAQKFCNATIHEGEDILQNCDVLLHTDTTDITTFLTNVTRMFSDLDKASQSISEAEHSLPYYPNISKYMCVLQGEEDVMKAIQGYMEPCSIPRLIAQNARITVPKEIRRIQCGKGQCLLLPWRISTLSDGSAIVCESDGSKMARVSLSGELHKLYSACKVYASFVDGEHVYLAKADGSSLVKLTIDTQSMESFPYLPNVSSPWSVFLDGEKVYTLHKKGVVQSHLSKPGNKEMFRGNDFHGFKLKRLAPPEFIVVDRSKHEVGIYDDSGAKIVTFGGKGTGKGQFHSPLGMSFTANGHLLVADWRNNRICEYTANGIFRRNLLTIYDWLYYPCDVALCFPYLWVCEHVTFKDRDGHACLKLFRFDKI